MNPEHLNRYLYAENTPTWWVRLVYVTGILVWLPVVWAALHIVGERPVYTWIFLTIIFFLTVHYLSSFALNLFYKQFDVKKHQKFREKFWAENKEPSVDVYLPICGEELPVLKNTWKYVSRLKYKNIKVYVLDDSKEETDTHRQLAKRYGFTYLERPNKGEMKKAGNLKYAFLRTQGDLIAIFDADFAPHPEYLQELVPYMADPKIGIVQSPQYFPTTKETHDTGPLAFGGARAQEIFYRIIQVARDQLDGAHCCGTCAVYRRAALDSIGGFVQIGHSEDAHTGYTLTAHHWVIRYVPLVISVGISPEDPHAFFHQQHRWCLGNTMMMMDKKFWQAPIPWKVKFCYMTGFLFYLHQPLLLIFPFQLFIVLFLYQDTIDIMDGLWFYPHIVWAFSFMFFFYLSPFRWGYLYAIMLRMYAYCHATFTEIVGGTVGWIPTNSKQLGVSTAFMQTVIWTSVYFFAYLSCIALATRLGLFNWVDPNYLIVEFWIIYNIAIIGFVLWKLYGVVLRARRQQVDHGHLEHAHYKKWQLQTAGSYVLVSTVCFAVIAGVPLGNTIDRLFNVPPGGMVAAVTTSLEAEEDVATILKVAPPTMFFGQDLQRGTQGEEVRELQQFLNTQGYLLSGSGPGSPGEETTYFGDRTFGALVKFQEVNNIAATGYFGPQTRAIVNELRDVEPQQS